MNFIMFSKYHLRVQKVIAQTLKNAPGRFLGIFALEGLIGTDITTISDSALEGLNTGLPPIEAGIDGLTSGASVLPNVLRTLAN